MVSRLLSQRIQRVKMMVTKILPHLKLFFLEILVVVRTACPPPFVTNGATFSSLTTTVCAFKLSMSSSFYITGPVFHLLAIFLIDPASSN
jgi:hypothetical protein